MVTTEEKLWSIFCHVSGLILPILVPLLVLLLKKESPFIRNHAREALVFQLVIHMAIYFSMLALYILIGFITLPILIIYGFIVIFLALLRTIDGKEFHYPITSRWAQKL